MKNAAKTFLFSTQDGGTVRADAKTEDAARAIIEARNGDKAASLRLLRSY
jgi:hypothetical protein